MNTLDLAALHDAATLAAQCRQVLAGLHSPARGEERTLRWTQRDARRVEQRLHQLLAARKQEES